MNSVDYLSPSGGRYLCQQCGSDITKIVRRWIPGSHGPRKIGAETFECPCGKRYQTGAKKIRIKGLAFATFFLVGFFAFIPAGFVLVAGGGFRRLTDELEGRATHSLVVGAMVGLVLGACLVSRFAFGVWTSVRRTRKLIAESQ